MLDFNESPKRSAPTHEAEREEIRQALLGQLESVLFTLFPAGKVRHGKFYIGDVLGSQATAWRLCSPVRRQDCGPTVPVAKVAMCSI